MIKKSDSGFTLIEIVLAISILAIIIVPLLGLYFQYDNFFIRTDSSYIAQSIASDKIESFRALNDEGSFSSIQSGQDTIIKRNTKYTANTKVTAVMTDFINVDVTVTWAEGGNTKNVMLSTSISKR